MAAAVSSGENGFGQKKSEELEGKWVAALSSKPTDPQILCGYATFLAKAGEYDRAQEVYQRSLTSDKTHLGTLCNYAVMLEARGREEEACELYKQAIDADGGQVIALSNYGHLLCRNGHLDKAEEIFKQGLKHHPSDVMLLHNYGCLLWEGRGEYTRAEGMLQKALKIDPGHGATVQALDDLKADKMSATVRADANAAKLLAQVEGEKKGHDKKKRRKKKDKGKAQAQVAAEASVEANAVAAAEAALEQQGKAPCSLRIEKREADKLTVSFEVDKDMSATHCQAQWDGVPLRQQPLVDGVNLCTVSHPWRLPGGAHTLRICVRDGVKGTYGPWSSALEVEIEKAPPAQPALRNSRQKKDKKAKKVAKSLSFGETAAKSEPPPFDCSASRKSSYDLGDSARAAAAASEGPSKVGEEGRVVLRTSSLGKYVDPDLSPPEPKCDEGQEGSRTPGGCEHRTVSWADDQPAGCRRLASGLEKMGGMIGDLPSPLIAPQGNHENPSPALRPSDSRDGAKRSGGGGGGRASCHYWMSMEGENGDDETEANDVARSSAPASARNPSTVRIAHFSARGPTVDVGAQMSDGRPPPPPKSKPIFMSSSEEEDADSSSCSEAEREENASPATLRPVGVGKPRRGGSSCWLTLSFAVEQNGETSVVGKVTSLPNMSMPHGPLPPGPMIPSNPTPDDGESPRFNPSSVAAASPPRPVTFSMSNPMASYSSSSSSSSNSSSGNALTKAAACSQPASGAGGNLTGRAISAATTNASSGPSGGSSKMSSSDSEAPPRPNPMANFSSSPSNFKPPPPNPMASYSTPPSDFKPPPPNPMASYSSSPSEFKPPPPNPMASYSSSASDFKPPPPNPMASYSSSPSEFKPPPPNPMANFSSSPSDFRPPPPNPMASIAISSKSSAKASSPSAVCRDNQPSASCGPSSSSTGPSGPHPTSSFDHADAAIRRISGGFGQEGQEDECVICFEGDKSHALIPCGHLVLCEKCSGMVGKGNGAKLQTCPMCNAELVAPYVVKVFKS